ncbi:hypothetical protein [Thioclava electrotropha]|uniref:Uncharacterized protein n=1 Tax=Thioclava electrotropha TaxID=1549850 RepID=A0ABX6YTS6_9RHOB|nr:hypothetical protein [Thioclava electrotropha]QPZ90643.1 hypothetical protein AKL02_006845 [Thioclava electrotropha]
MTKLPVKALPANDSGRLLVRLNKAYRAGIPRYGIANLSNAENAKSVKVLVLGHDDGSAIFMPYDIREALGVDKGGSLNFSITKVRWPGKIGWLLKTPDPAVHVPAWLALMSVLLGVISITIALCE